ncbi:MAG TPA: hypothetical protein VN808_09145, partial [Stellaceae bacterium]|nr:hypothetical protein [Stellaceae bacterium]
SEWLEWASAMARWLDYLPFERLRDERNKPPLVLAYAEILAPGVAELTTTESVIGLPEISTMLPRVSGFSPTAPQPFRIILIVEKSSLADVLKPIADRVKGTLLLFTGEASATRIAEEALRAIADARRAVVLYFADFDPAGHQMPISVARKLQALRTLKHPSLQIDFHRVALTVDQVRALNLPSTPLKPTEKRGARWREAMGHEQTEIDALLELRPDELRRIATEALQPFYDFTLDQRCKEAFEAAQAEATKKLDEHPARAAHEKRIRAAHAKAQKAINALRRAQVRAVETLRERDAGVGATEIPAPEVQIEVKPPKPFFTTDDDFVTATTKLIADKKYDFDFESEG